MLKEMTGKVAEVLETQDTVNEFLNEIEDAVTSGAKAVSEMETIVQAKKEGMTIYTELGEVKLAKTEIHSLIEEMELLKQVNANKVKAMYRQLEDKAEEFFNIHRSALILFKSVDDFYLLNTSLSELTESKIMLQGFANQLAYSFAGVRNLLLDTGIVAIGDQNKSYRGIHLGQIVRETQLAEFVTKVRPFINDLNRAGVAIR